MPDVLAVDRLDVLVLVDNVTDSLSTNPPNVAPEWSVLFGDGRLRLLAGKNICCAHHGLSLLLTAHVGGATRTLLFDAGPAAETFTRNAASSASTSPQSRRWCSRTAIGIMPAASSLRSTRSQRTAATAASTATCIRACTDNARRGDPTARST